MQKKMQDANNSNGVTSQSTKLSNHQNVAQSYWQERRRVSVG